MKKVKLYVLKWIIMAIIKMAIIINIKGLKYPLTWLLHYLEGSGTPMEVPPSLVQGAKSAFAKAVYYDCYETLEEREWEGKYCICHSTLYEGRGFYNRPTLFYLLGGFSFEAIKTSKGVAVIGEDTYDWHPTQEGNYFTSPLGDNFLINLLVKLMGIIFGGEYFVSNGFPSGETGISNKLWADFEKVGAKPFKSKFKTVLWTSKEFKELIGGTNIKRKNIRYTEIENGMELYHTSFTSVSSIIKTLERNGVNTSVFNISLKEMGVAIITTK